ncbi:MAG TPA: hypothetical protein VLJ88_01300 [Propionibacteriaceae bacterium]|nr:hypothetical protein [Propionibacteriaceae bacterium]
MVQTRPAGSDDLEWRPMGAEVRLHASGDDLADIRWHATVSRPELRPDNENRLVLTEYELFETDVSQADTWADRPAGGLRRIPSQAGWAPPGLRHRVRPVTRAPWSHVSPHKATNDCGSRQ